jgi:glycosyltransferase involved in cell wall biosynthesis
MMRDEGWRTIVPRRIGQETPLFVVAAAGGWRAFDLITDEAALAEFARSAGVRRLVINHLIDLPQDAADRLARLAGEIGADYEVVLHDYYLACPRIDLIASDGRYCGLAPVERCRDCLAASGPALRDVDPKAWRARSRALLDGATRAIAPSQDLADRLSAAFPGARIEVEEPEQDSALPVSVSPPPLATSEPMRVLILGALNRPKGLDVILGLARALARRRAPVRIAVLGPAADEAALRRAGVRVRGRYRPEELDELMAAERPHVIFFPAIWPETWSFALTEALRTNADVLAFDIGAIAQRLKRLGRGHLLDYGLHADAEAVAEALLALRRGLAERI